MLAWLTPRTHLARKTKTIVYVARTRLFALSYSTRPKQKVPASYRNRNLSILEASILRRALRCDGTLHERSLVRSTGSIAFAPIPSHRWVCRTRVPAVCGHDSPHPAPGVDVGPGGEFHPDAIVQITFQTSTSSPLVWYHAWPISCQRGVRAILN